MFENGMKLSPSAGKLPETENLLDVPRLLRAYDSNEPDPMIASQMVQFGTSGHRGSAFDSSFNKNHIMAISQAVCDFRKYHKITGPLFIGFDTHALSIPAFQTTLEVLAANHVNVMTAAHQEFTPTPVISHAILGYNRNRTTGWADGIVITPSHNPPREGGFKYNPTHGGPAEKRITDWIQNRSNFLLEQKLAHIQRIPFERALRAPTTFHYDFITPYIRDLEEVIDFNVIREAKIKMGVDPLGGAGIHYWEPIGEKYKIDLSVTNSSVDPTFRFITQDWDGQIRMDPSSPYAMVPVIEKKNSFDVSFACDTDHDRHGIVSKNSGLIPANQYLCASIFYLFHHRPEWPSHLKIGKTLVSSQMIDRVAKNLNRPVYEVPVGFKWFVDHLLNSTLGFAGEESAGSTFLRKDGSVWTTDKDGIVPCLLAAEMTAKLGKDPAALYQDLTQSLGNPAYRRAEIPATPEQKKKLEAALIQPIQLKELGGSSLERIFTHAPGNGEPIGGIKMETNEGWIAIRPSGTEDVIKIYAESFVDERHLNLLLTEGQEMITD